MLLWFLLPFFLSLDATECAWEEWDCCDLEFDPDWLWEPDGSSSQLDSSLDFLEDEEDA